MIPLEKAQQSLKESRFHDAASGFVAVLQDQPKHVEALWGLASALLNLGHPHDALAPAVRATQLARRSVRAWLTAAQVQTALGDWDDALRSARRALTLDASSDDCHLTLALLHVAKNQFDNAILAASRAKGPGPLADLAVQFAKAGEPLFAARAAKTALARSPDHPDLNARAGIFLVQSGQPRRALGPLRTAADAGITWAPLMLAEAYDQIGESASAATWFAEATQHTVAAWARLADVAWQHGSLPESVSDALLVEAFGHQIDHQRLERAVRARLTSVPDDALPDHPLFHPWLRHTLVAEPDAERRLVRLRSAWSLRCSETPIQQALVSIAVQAWNTEYAWARPEVGEPPAVPPVPNAESIAAICRHAAHAPLRALPDSDHLNHSAWSDTVLADLIKGQITTAAPSQDIPVFTAIEDETSRKVASQYESHPYPRLVAVQRREPEPIRDWLRSRFPDAGSWPSGPKVLVAGTGTGQHPLTTATTFRDVAVLGIDLSAASLARAQTHADRLGIHNVRFGQADILALDLEERFEIIESVGVLHHLEDPSAGLARLVHHLAPSGWMRLGLYSEAARQDVVAARALLAMEGFASDDEGIRSARARLASLPADHPAFPVVRSIDFYSLSGCRDLVMHVCEHRFTLPQLHSWLSNAGLEFIGFQNPVPGAKEAYRQRFGDAPLNDLANWHAVETERPHLFAGMYVFWCRRAT